MGYYLAACFLDRTRRSKYNDANMSHMVYGVWWRNEGSFSASKVMNARH
jgi:hypothetical protein